MEGQAWRDGDGVGDHEHDESSRGRLVAISRSSRGGGYGIGGRPGAKSPDEALSSRAGLLVTQNLIDDPWIPVMRESGLERVGVRTALVDSHEIDEVVLLPRTAWVAVLRQVLFPVVADALGFPDSRSEWSERYGRGRFDAGALDRYFDTYRARFDVFDERAPFAQVAGLRAARDETKPSSLLVPSIPTGNNVPLFGARTEADPPTLDWTEAITWVLHAHCWDTAGLKTGAVGDPRAQAGKTTGNPIGPLGALGVVVPTGPNLFSTIMLNLPIVSAVRSSDEFNDSDLPQWRREPNDASWRTRAATGRLDLWTWQARRIRLIPSEDALTGRTVVRQVTVTAGDRLQLVPEYEPHTGWTANRKPKPGDPPRRPRRHRVGRAAWRGLDGLVASEASADTRSGLLLQIGELQASGILPEEFPLGLATIGTEYGNQMAVVESVLSDEIPFPIVALHDLGLGEVVGRLATDTDALVQALDGLEGDLLRAQGADLPSWDKGERGSLRFVYRVDASARRFLGGVRREPARWADGFAAWRSAARQAVELTADELIDQLPSSAVLGRERQGRFYRASIAEARFRWKVDSILGDRSSDAPGRAETGGAA
jgi:CRISPR system Cascade subunit CasA